MQKDILPLQGFRPQLHSYGIDAGLGTVRNAFPNHSFPLGAIHEFLCEGEETRAASTGFISGLLAPLMRNGSMVLWIGRGLHGFPPALRSFGISPENIIFVEVKKEKETLWTLEEALRSGGLAAVVGEISDLDFTASRRLQLAVEQTKVTGLVLRCKPRLSITTAYIARWKIKPLPSKTPDGLPGVGFPRWNVELLKVRNGRPGSWQLEWSAGKFRHIQPLRSVEQQKKAG